MERVIDMKKILSLVFVLVMVLTFAGCKSAKSSSNDEQELQASGLGMATDLSGKAREYTDVLFDEMLKEQGITDYDITRTNYGFITEDPVVFIVGYEYSINGNDSDNIYGYKLTVNDGLMFHVTEEGPSVAQCVMEETPSDTGTEN